MNQQSTILMHGFLADRYKNRVKVERSEPCSQSNLVQSDLIKSRAEDIPRHDHILADIILCSEFSPPRISYHVNRGLFIRQF